MFKFYQNKKTEENDQYSRFQKSYVKYFSINQKFLKSTQRSLKLHGRYKGFALKYKIEFFETIMF